ncbi:MAG: formate dehydrogenase accessory sulfurtransferase FdhD [Magnetovibrio sp.]|nr:formate dehydrogenase accessory sulfurtransferase FdhD [Magnetovibrio sp.]
MNLIAASKPTACDLSRKVEGFDQDGNRVCMAVAMERAVTLYVNKREIVTLMSIGDHPVFLALGYLFNQGMVRHVEDVQSVHYDDDVQAIAVTTRSDIALAQKLGKVTITSGCGQGTVFGDMMELFDNAVLPQGQVVHTSWLLDLLKRINTMPSLYLETGAVHGCVLCQGAHPLVYMEDVGRHNAVDKIAGYMLKKGVSGTDKILYTTGRLTSEMVIKCVNMGIPVLVSRSGFTAMGVDLARRVGLTLIGRAKGKRHVVLSGAERIVRDGVMQQGA